MPNFNAFMHRRNIFRKEPDFKKLACDYQELKPFMTVSSKNKLKFDFKNPDALRALTCALLHRYFQKRITLPSDRMIPAVPQRLNYICWVEDLVKLVELQQPDAKIVGMDIGTGASCIFPILSCHRNPTWSFIGVEADAKSYAVALENVKKNFMEDRIHIVKITTEDTLSNVLCGNWMLSSDPITFIMCNPPFFEEEYGVTLEMNPSVGSSNDTTSSTGRPKSNSNTSDKIESVVSGGEISFVGHMLEESCHLRGEVSIYTSMLGKKQSLTHFKQTLSSLNEENLSWTWAELCQGKTIRYAIAWTFKPGLDLQRAPPLRHGKNKSWKFKLLRKMPKRDGQLELLENGEFLKNLITRELLIAKARVTKQTAQTFEMLIKTNDRTWTNQRRKRREHTNKHKHQATSSSINYANSSSVLTTTPVSPQSMIGLTLHNDPCNDTSTQMVCDSDSSTTKDVPHVTTQEGSTMSHFASSTIAFTLDNLDNRIMQDMNPELYSQENPTDLTSHNNLPTSNQTNMIVVNQQQQQTTASVNQPTIATNNFIISSKKRKNPSSCSSSPSRVCPSPNDELTDDDNQSTDNSDYDDQNDDAMNDIVEIKRICIKDTDDCENMDDIYDYLLCCRISLSRVCHDLYFELKLEHPCTAANDAYDLFQYFRNKLSEK